MGKGEELTTTKYLIHAQITANGIVEKPDVVGAVFGQTEGLLSNDLDLRELQRTGRIGRIQVNIHSNSGRAKGEIVIPSSVFIKMSSGDSWTIICFGSDISLICAGLSDITSGVEAQEVRINDAKVLVKINVVFFMFSF